MNKVEKTRVLELFIYDKNKGTFYHKFDKGTACKKGTKAGTKTKLGYIRMNIDGKNFLAHRLVWLCEYGCMPTFHLDHINHTTSDNRLCNLREATMKLNAQNKIKPTSSNPYLGVCFVKRLGKWKSAIHINGKSIHIGMFM